MRLLSVGFGGDNTDSTSPKHLSAIAQMPTPIDPPRPPKLRISTIKPSRSTPHPSPTILSTHTQPHPDLAAYLNEGAPLEKPNPCLSEVSTVADGA